MPRAQSGRYYRFYGPVLDALRELGGSGTPTEVRRATLSRVKLSPDEMRRELSSGDNAVENEIAWVRNDLRELGLLDGSERGVWRLTDVGRNTRVTLEQARQLRAGLIKQIALRRKRTRDATATGDLVSTTEPIRLEPVAPELEGAHDLLTVLQSLSPAGFERLCQRLLREAGFSEVNVTGRTGDGGIDGNGVLQINELMSFKVLFQCKRYRQSVKVKEVRDFRGALSGRTDKGIFITTSSFTADAEREAMREGAIPVELVDGERLTALMERLGMGVRSRVVYDVDDRFFDEYR
jgi:restriction system protein